MKCFLLFIFTLLLVTAQAQKYALLDKSLATPIVYVEHVTSADKFKKLFPVEKKYLPQFIKALEEITKKLEAKGRIGTAKQYQVGCVHFTGLTVSLASGDRLDYVITADCDNLKISMHLCDAKYSNANNSFFINTFIKYVEDARPK
ncbi:MAG: hypothetical protein ABIN25_08675 [Ginsengibacter sp.]